MSEAKDRPKPDPHSLISLKDAITSNDAASLRRLIMQLPLADALRELLQLSVAERALVLSLLPSNLAASLIEDVPNELGAGLIETLETAHAVKIIDELASDIKADLIGEMEHREAEAILSEMDPDEAAGIRRLVEYAKDTAGGLMMTETFHFADTKTVGAVLRDLSADDQDIERYRGAHPYILDSAGKPIGVVSLRGLLTATPRHSRWRTATFETLRSTFLKIAVRVRQLKSRISIALPTVCPQRETLIMLLGRINAQSP